MKLVPNTYLIMLRGRCVGTVSYQHGMLLTLTLSTGVQHDVMEVLAQLPGREANLHHAASPLAFVDVSNIIAQS